MKNFSPIFNDKLQLPGWRVDLELRVNSWCFNILGTIKNKNLEINFLFHLLCMILFSVQYNHDDNS